MITYQVKHTVNFEIIGMDTVWTCIDCGRQQIENADGVTIVEKGNLTADHDTFISPAPDFLSLSVGGDVDKDRLDVFSKFLDGDE